VQEGRRGEGNKREERVVGKAAGDECFFIPGERTGLADEVGSDAIPEAAGGEGGHGAAKPDGVIHRYRIYRMYRGICEKAAENGVLSTAPQIREFHYSINGRVEVG
jgi:hypothetical protein